MNERTIVKALSKWNLWGSELELGISRDNYLKQALLYLKANKILTIVGLRRSGKSYIAKQIAKNLVKEKHNSLIINFEEARFDEDLDTNFLVRLYDAYLSVLKPSEKPLIVLDEVQEVTGWEKFVRSLYEKKEADLIVTGSSAKIMSEELATVLTGRTLTLDVFPLGFREFLEFNGLKLGTRLEIIKEEERIRELLKAYLSFGGFPEIVLQKNEQLKLKILRSYYDDILNKDIVKRYNIRRVDKLERIAFHYLTNFSSLITFNRTGKYLKLSEKIVEIYSKYLESSKILFFLPRFSSSVKEQENSPRKVYLMDIGFHNLSTILFSDKTSKIYENIVAIQLLKSFSKREIFYWKDYSGREVDFLVKKGYKVELIQVCYSLDRKETKQREIQALLKAMEEFNLKEGIVITEDYENNELINNKKIRFIPLWKWLLDYKLK